MNSKLNPIDLQRWLENVSEATTNKDVSFTAGDVFIQNVIESWSADRNIAVEAAQNWAPKYKDILEKIIKLRTEFEQRKEEMEINEKIVRDIWEFAVGGLDEKGNRRTFQTVMKPLFERYGYELESARADREARKRKSVKE